MVNPTPTYAITLKTRRDGIQCYFFTIDGETRFSSYDAKAIKNFAMGYCGRDLTIEDMGMMPVCKID